MKTLLSLLMSHFKTRAHRRNLRALVRFLCVLAAMVLVYSLGFHFLMAREGHDHSWLTGVYWTLTVMSTLGFGDITFHTDAGRVFSVVVLLSGIVFLLVLLPFTFIEFFYEPWMKAQAAARVPRSVKPETSGHVLLTKYGPVGAALVKRLEQFGYPHVLVLPELDEAIRLHDEGLTVVVGDLDDPETWKRARADQAALAFTTRSDMANTNVVFTIREVAPDVPIVATAHRRGAREVLRLAGCTRVFELPVMLGEMLARRTRGGSRVTHVIGQFDDLLIAEVNACETPLVGQSLQEAGLRALTGVGVVGAWERGKFAIARPETIVGEHTVLVIVGSAEQLGRLDAVCRPPESVGPDGKPESAAAHPTPVVILGGGRVGRATADALAERGLESRIVEQEADRIRDLSVAVHGDATDPATLRKAGILSTSAVIVTTHDDDTNIYLTLFCRKLRPDAQIISRATLERNVPTLHRAGADSVISYASMGASAVFNMLERSDIVMVAEGLDVFRVQVPADLAGRRINELALRQETGCSIVGMEADGKTQINPDPASAIPEKGWLTLIGTVAAERAFLTLYPQADTRTKKP